MDIRTAAATVDPRTLTYFDWLWLKQRPGGYRAWVILGLGLTALCIILYYQTGMLTYITTFLPLSLGVVGVPIAIRLGYRIVVGWEASAVRFVVVKPQAFHDWFGNQIVAYLRSWDVPLFGLVYLLAASVAFHYSGAFAGMSALDLTAAGFVLAVSAFCCGIGVATIIRLARIVWRLGQFQVEVTASRFGVKSTGPMLLRCYLLAGVIWCLYTSSAGWNLTAGWIPMLALAVPAILIITGSFVIAQLPLHHRMLEYKRARTYEIESFLKELAPRTSEDLTEERLKQLEFLRSEADKIAALPEWPFGWWSLTGAFMASVVSVSPTIIGFVLGQLFPEAKS